MNFFIFMIVIVALIGVVVALYEWRIKKTLLRHDLMRHVGRQTEAEWQALRNRGKMAGRMIVSRFPPN